MSTPIADPAAEEVLSDPTTSTWLKRTLRESLERDPVDALNDVLALAGILEERLRTMFDLDDAV